MTSDSTSGTAVFIGNLKQVARIGELKTNLHVLFRKVLKIAITQNDISIINGRKRYAIIDVHNKQNVDFVLENLTNFEDRKKIKYNFLHLVDPGVPLHVDTLKSQDERQARDDFENAKNVKPYQKQKRDFKPTQLSADLGRAVSVKSLKSSFTSGRISKSSVPSTKGGDITPSVKSTTDIATNTDLDVTIDEFLKETGKLPAQNNEVHNRHTNSNIAPLAVSSEKEDSDDSLTQVETYRGPALSPIMDSESELCSDYEDPPGSVIDLRTTRRTPGTHRTRVNPSTKERSRKLASRSSDGTNDFFTYLDRQLRPEMSDRSSKSRRAAKSNPKQNVSYTEEDEEEEGTPYYKFGERVLNEDRTKEFKHYDTRDSQFTLRKMRDHVARCICGFLNSQQGGVVLIGITEEGIVAGIECTVSQEERYHRHIEETMREIYPPIIASNYYIHFAPVIGDNGRQQADLKVVEIFIDKVPNRDILFECKEGVFIRRKGILTGPIRPSHIQEWIKVKHFKEIDELKDKEALMKSELEQKDLLLRRQADTILSQRSELDRQKNVTYAKSCCIL